MQDYNVKFERSIGEETRLGHAPVHAENEDQAEDRFLASVEEEEQFTVYDVERRL